MSHNNSQSSTIKAPLLPTGYKQTEVGVIPEQWEIKAGDEITSLIGKGASPRWQGFEYANSGMLFVTSENVRDGFLDVREPKYLPLAFHEKLSRTKLQRGDILVNLVGASIGRSCQIQQDLGDANVNQAVGVFRVKDDYCSAYVACCFQSPITIRRILEMQVDAARPNFSLGDLRRFLLPLPSSAEQSAIAEALSDVDELLGGLDRLIAKKRDLKKAAMQQLLTGQTRLPGFQGEWEVKAIHELSHVGRGRVISHTEISKAASPTYPVYSSQTSNSGIMGYLDTYDFDGDYVTWTTDGANAGTVFARSGRFNCTNVCGTVRLHDSDHRFIAAALGRVSQSHVSRHLGNPKLMNDVMKKIQVMIPKTRAEQTAIAEVLTAMDGELAVLEQRQEKSVALKQAMMQELLTGRTRLL